MVYEKMVNVGSSEYSRAYVGRDLHWENKTSQLKRSIAHILNAFLTLKESL